MGRERVIGTAMGSKKEKLGEMRSSKRERMRDFEEREKEIDICE